MVNTMMEALIPDLESLSKGQSLMAILSNYATESLVTASCQVDIRFLSRDKTEAQQLAKNGLGKSISSSGLLPSCHP